MNISIMFTRILFAILSVFFMIIYMTSSNPTASNAVLGIVLGVVLMVILIAFDIIFRRYNLRAFNTAVVGLFVGYLMGQALVLIFNTILGISQISIHLTPQGLEIIRISLFLFGTYVGTLMTLRASDEFYLSIPFVRFSALEQKKKDLVIDASVLSDSRILDICSTGLLDHHLIVPRFIVSELYADAESSDETQSTRAKRALDVLKKMQDMTHLGMRYNETNFPNVNDATAKLIRLARLLDANVLTADISRVQMSSIEGVRIVNIHSLSNALKPLMETGEMMNIKVQRVGKEARQGVGYLDDGTMVVINGGGDYVGALIPAQVLSVKHTASGRIIFCNATENVEEPFTNIDKDSEND
jgi:uncharacterized protein YacL